MAAAAEHDFVIDRAADNKFILLIVGGDGSAIDVSGDSFYADIRIKTTKKRAKQLTCTPSVSPVNEVEISLSDDDSLDLNPNIEYEWDLFRVAVADGTTTRLLYGDAPVRDNATTGAPIE